MSSETTLVVEQCRLQEWAAQIRECQHRPADMSIVSWCACHGIKKSELLLPAPPCKGSLP